MQLTHDNKTGSGSDQNARIRIRLKYPDPDPTKIFLCATRGPNTGGVGQLRHQPQGGQRQRRRKRRLIKEKREDEKKSIKTTWFHYLVAAQFARASMNNKSRNLANFSSLFVRKRI